MKSNFRNEKEKRQKKGKFSTQAQVSRKQHLLETQVNSRMEGGVE